MITYLSKMGELIPIWSDLEYHQLTFFNIEANSSAISLASFFQSLGIITYFSPRLRRANSISQHNGVLSPLYAIKQSYSSE